MFRLYIQFAGETHYNAIVYSEAEGKYIPHGKPVDCSKPQGSAMSLGGIGEEITNLDKEFGERIIDIEIVPVK